SVAEGAMRSANRQLIDSQKQSPPQMNRRNPTMRKAHCARKAHPHFQPRRRGFSLTARDCARECETFGAFLSLPVIAQVICVTSVYETIRPRAIVRDALGVLYRKIWRRYPWTSNA